MDIEFSPKVTALEAQRAELDKLIQEEREKAKAEALSIIEKFGIKPEELETKTE